MSWSKSTLGEIYDKEGGKIQTGPFGSQLHESDYKEFGIPVIMPKDIIDDKLDISSIARISEKDAQRLKRHIVRENDIIFPRRGEINKRMLVDEQSKNAFCGTGCIRLRGTGRILNPLFLFYYTKQKQVVKWIENQAVGATMMNLNTSILKSVPIHFPPNIRTQQKIASILSAYDDLIENNNHRIQLLEEMAEEIYKEWFVRLRFPATAETPGYKEAVFVDKNGNKVKRGTAGALPEGWQSKKLNDILSKVKRKPKVKKDEYQEVGNIPVIDQGSDLIGGYVDDEIYLQNEPLPVVVFGDHTRRVKFIDFPFASGADGTQLIYPKNKNLLPTYFFLSIKRIDLSDFHYARHFKYLKKESILIPTPEILKAFNALTSPFLKEIDVLREKNQLLQETRDLLLPRLISGKLSVENMELEPEHTLAMAAEPGETYKSVKHQME